MKFGECEQYTKFQLLKSPSVPGHEGSPGVALAGVLAAVLVAGAQHVVVDSHLKHPPLLRSPTIFVTR